MFSYCKKLIILLLISILLPIHTSFYAFSSVSSESAVLMEQSSGRVLYAKNPHRRMRVASITKIMTAILAIESGKLNETVVISNSAVRTEGSSIYLQPGQEILLEDLVYGLMLRSGNDAALAIAETVGGSVEGFVYLMNQKAEQIGMKNTNFINPHGLDGRGMQHYSTSHDMALLTKYAMRNPKYVKIAGTKTHKAPNTTQDWDYQWRNKNKLLTTLYEYSTGGKTGYTKRAGRTLVSTATKNGMDLIAVTLRAGSDWDDHMHLFNTAFETYDLVTLLPSGLVQEVKKEPYTNHVYIKNEFYYPLKEEEKELKSIKYRIFTDEPLENNRKIGVAEIYLGSEKIGERSIFYSTNVIMLRSQFMLEEMKSVFTQMIGAGVSG